VKRSQSQSTIIIDAIGPFQDVRYLRNQSNQIVDNATVSYMLPIFLYYNIVLNFDKISILLPRCTKYGRLPVICFFVINYQHMSYKRKYELTDIPIITRFVTK
jgi:hypothetical protein